MQNVHPDYLWDFIEQNDLTHILYESILHIEDTFGKDTRVSLEIDTFNLEYIQLRLTILTPFDVDESRACLKALDKWWFRNCYRVNGKMTINMGYV